MNPSAPFIRRPVATTLLTIGIALAGFFAYLQLPVAPLPQVDFPTISVFATMPGASPDTMAATVATPLERHLGVIADVTEMTSESTVGLTRITLQFGLNRSIDGAARDVQAAINAARADLPTSLRQNPTYRKVNPADAPVAILAMTSETLTRGQIYDAASTVVQQALSQIDGIGQVDDQRQLAAGGAGRAQPAGAVQIRYRARRRSRGARLGQRAQPEGCDRRRRPPAADLHQRPGQPCRGLPAAGDRLPRRRGGAADRCRRSRGFGRKLAQSGARERQAGGAGDPLPAARRQHHRHGRPRKGGAAAARSLDPERHQCRADDGPDDDDHEARCTRSSARWSSRSASSSWSSSCSCAICALP